MNVTVDTSCLVILLTLFISQSYRRANGRPDWLFSICLAVNMINIFAELMAWMLEGLPKCSVKQGSMACSTSGETAVVAALSR